MTEAQRWSPEGYARHGHFVPALGEAVLELLQPQAGEHILDLGCGDGTLTKRLVERGANVVAVDSSAEMIAAARARDLDARVADAEHLGFESAFDAVFSNAALHWMRDTDAVLAGVRRALRANGRFVGEFGGHGNCASIVTALQAVLRARGVASVPQPWYFPTAAGFSARLERHDFSVETISLIPRPTRLPTDMRGWLETFANPFFSERTRDEREAMLDEASALLAPSLRDDDGVWTADYVRLRFAARAARNAA